MPEPTIQNRMADLVATEVRDATDEEMQDPAHRPTAKETFNAMSASEQDEMVGPEVAQMLRDGKISLTDLKTTEESPAEGEEGFIIPTPREELEG